MGSVVRTLFALYAIRMLGLFMVLPVLTLYSEQLSNATPLLIGFAMGAYGLTQALLQIPFGSWSDRIGRKPVIVIGLTLFLLGSLLAAVTDSVIGMIVARLLQGAGAVASTLMAFAADVTAPNERTKTMAKIGMSIGIAFAVSLVLGPMVAGELGLQALFWIVVGLSGIALLLAVSSLPHQPPVSNERTDMSGWKAIIVDPVLMKLNFSVLVLHAMLVGIFVLLPVKLTEFIELKNQGWLYLAVLMASFMVMIPLLIFAEKKGRSVSTMVVAVLFLGVGLWLMVGEFSGIAQVIIALFAFFAGFNLLEAKLPSELSKVAPETRRGAAMGVFSTHQFLGAFIGGLIGGLALSTNPDQWLLMLSVLTLPWALIVAGSSATTSTNQFYEKRRKARKEADSSTNQSVDQGDNKASYEGEKQAENYPHKRLATK